MLNSALRRRTGSVRVRTTIAAVVVVAVTLTISAIALSALLRRSMVRNLETSVELRSADVATLVRTGQFPEEIPEPRDEEDRALVQVVDETGRVVASSPDLQDEARIPPFLAPGEQLVTRILKRPPFEDDEDFVVVGRRVPTSTGSSVVYAAASLEDVDDTVGTVDRILFLGVPLVVLAVGATCWLVMGRALQPVEAMRARVAEITATNLSQRVPEPEVEDEIGRLARTMNVTLDRLEAATERQRRFVADASHELQSPMATVRAQLEVGLADAQRTDWPTTAAEVLDEQERMERLVQDLLFMASLDERKRHARREIVDLDDLVFEEARRVRSRGRVRVNLERLSAGQVVGNPDQLSRVIRNLIENAERHARTTVDVELQTHESFVELTVSDDGEGIPVADRDRVFERFTRLDNGRARAEGGTGLGLAIAREVVEAHGGQISVLDSLVGTRLGVRLPSALSLLSAPVSDVRDHGGDPPRP
jgi:signal transduction histidine kinase